jgi:hypothetical protein
MNNMVPYTIILRKPSGQYIVEYLNLVQGINAARRQLGDYLLLSRSDELEVAALLPGLHSTGLPERRSLGTCND